MYMGISTFYIIKRNKKSKNSKAGYVVRFVDEAGKTVRQVSLPEARNKNQAREMAQTIMQGGVISNQSDTEIIPFLLDTWRRESDYVKGRALRGIVLSENYINQNRYLTEKYLAPRLKGVTLSEITAEDAEKLILSLSRSGIGNRQINMILQCLRVPFRWWCRLHHVVNRLADIQPLRENPRERGLLAMNELRSILSLENLNLRVKTAIALASLCGLRAGECRGLYFEDVDDENGMIHVCGNVTNDDEGRKLPKWGSKRDVPAPQIVIDLIRQCAEYPPYERKFVLWNQASPERAVPPHKIEQGYREALRMIGITDEERKERNLCFHGLRHLYVSMSRSAGVPDFVVQRIVGHRSMRMTDSYSHLSKDDVQNARERIGNVISFPVKNAEDTNIKDEKAAGSGEVKP